MFVVMFIAMTFSAFAEWTSESLFCGLKTGMSEKDCRTSLENICQKYATNADSLCGDTVYTDENNVLTAVIYTTSTIDELELDKIYRCMRVKCFFESEKVAYYAVEISNATKDDCLANMTSDYNFIRNTQDFDVYDAGKKQILGIKELSDFYADGSDTEGVTILVNPKR